jgi:hypothetical protein
LINNIKFLVILFNEGWSESKVLLRIGENVYPTVFWFSGFLAVVNRRSDYCLLLFKNEIEAEILVKEQLNLNCYLTLEVIVSL